MWQQFFREELHKLAFPEEREDGREDGRMLWEEDLIRAITKMNEDGNMNDDYSTGLKDALNEKRAVI